MIIMEQYLLKVKTFIKECVRVLKITKKPGKEEFKTIVKVTSLGIVIIGTLGFLLLIAGTLNL